MDHNDALIPFPALVRTSRNFLFFNHNITAKAKLKMGLVISTFYCAYVGSENDCSVCWPWMGMLFCMFKHCIHACSLAGHFQLMTSREKAVFCSDRVSQGLWIRWLFIFNIYFWLVGHHLKCIISLYVASKLSIYIDKVVFSVSQ